jgi:hypothetical protein
MVFTVPLAKLQYLHTRYCGSGTNPNLTVTLPSLISFFTHAVWAQLCFICRTPPLAVFATSDRDADLEQLSFRDFQQRRVFSVRAPRNIRINRHG